MEKQSVVAVLRRLDWIRARLIAGKPFNATDIAAKFRISTKTASRDMKIIRSYYRMKVRFDGRERTFYLK
jgi:hypothetical protein